jgi:hypothetical protein
MRRIWKLFRVNGGSAGAAGSSSWWMVVVLDKKSHVMEAVRGERWWCWSRGKKLKVDGGGIGQCA